MRRGEKEISRKTTAREVKRKEIPRAKHVK
jgi:hypothetical protein